MAHDLTCAAVTSRAAGRRGAGIAGWDAWSGTLGCALWAAALFGPVTAACCRAGTPPGEAIATKTSTTLPGEAIAKKTIATLPSKAIATKTPATLPSKAIAKKKKALAAEAAPPGDAIDALGANLACYVCHTTFIKEEMVQVHLKENIGCIKCHGLSDKHANDENVGATKPDVTFKRPKVDASCAQCHEGHDAPATAVIARFLERHLPADRTPICTDCHGTHKIDRSAALK
jgi:hypothetical protein